MTAPLTRIVLATSNPGKVAEMSALLPGVTILSLTDVGFTDAIPEPYETFRENARAKAETVFAAAGIPALADDSGLCVEALNGKPGVQSARYAGNVQDAGKNMAKLLEGLDGVADRRACFIAVLCLCDSSGIRYFEGRCEGKISGKAFGTGGFGYDPVFVPAGYIRTFGELPASVKAGISHRAKALAALRAALAL